VSRTLRDGVVIAIMIALGGVTMLGVAGCGGKSSTRIYQRPLSPEDRAVAAGHYFLDRYVRPDGRVVRLDQGGDTVGEGQAYGMLIAAAVGDRRRFDAIWAWTRSHLVRPDGLLSFLWKNGHVVDPQAASDADVDASRALLVAACRFQEPFLRQEALALGHSILRVEVGSATFRGQAVLSAGPWAISPPPVAVNPSYFSPATFLALEAASRDPRWRDLALSSRAVTGDLMPSPGRLPPNWSYLEGDRAVPIGDPSRPLSPPQFGFDAVRTLVRFAEDPDPDGRRIAARAWTVFASANPTTLPVEHDLNGQVAGHTLHPVALVAAAGAADAAGQPAARDGLLDQAEALDRRTPTYFGAAWVALGRLMLTTNLLQPSC
jgi:endoglucanase